MIFGSISYLNLLPFQLYLKKTLKSSQQKQIINYKKDAPSSINIKFKKRVVDAAFISSVKSSNKKCTNLGIIADGAVYSVLVLPKGQMFDSESDTSNALSTILDIKGEVIIGDKALRYYLNNRDSSFKDLSLEWKKRYNLPFVFARLCFNKKDREVQKLAKKFKPHSQKIPYYYLKREAFKKGISIKELKWYLKHISYRLEHKELKSLNKFLILARKGATL